MRARCVEERGRCRAREGGQCAPARRKEVFKRAAVRVRWRGVREDLADGVDDLGTGHHGLSARVRVVPVFLPVDSMAHCMVSWTLGGARGCGRCSSCALFVVHARGVCRWWVLSSFVRKADLRQVDGGYFRAKARRGEPGQVDAGGGTDDELDAFGAHNR